MTTRLASLLAAAALLTSATVSAQTVVVRGQIQSGRATGCYYCPSVPWALKYSETPITSSSVNLNLYLGLDVEITANWNGSTSAPSLDVTAVSIVSQSFSFAGQGRLGQDFRFTVNGTPGDFAINAGSFDRSFLAFGQLGFFLDPTVAFVLGIGAIDGGGQFRSVLSIPNDPSFVGLHVFGQGLIAPANGALYTTSMRADFVAQ